MNRRPVGRRVERTDAQGEELGLWVHLVIWGSPAPWNIIRHVKSGVKQAGRENIGLECDGSTEGQPREGGKWPEKPKCGKGTKIKKNPRETNPKRQKSKKLHRNEVSIG